MSATSRTIQTTLAMRPVGSALLAVGLLLALVALLAFGQLAAAKPQVATPGTAPVVHDHGWSTASGPASGGAAVDAGRHRPKTPIGVLRGTGPASGGTAPTVNAFSGFTTSDGGTGKASSTRIRFAR